MRLKRRGPAAVLCLCMVSMLLLATGCSGNDGADNSPSGAKGSEPGRYIEYDVTPPIDGEFMVFLTEGDNIACFDRGLTVRCDSADGGKTWGTSEGPGAGSDRYSSVQSGSVSPDGSVFVYLEGEGIIRILPDGSEEKVPVGDLDDAVANGEGVMLTVFKALSADRLYLSWAAGSFISSQRIDPGDGGPDGAVSGNGPAGAGGGSVSGSVQAPAGPGGGSPGNGPVRQNQPVSFDGPAGFHTGLYAADGSLVADLSNINAGLVAAEGDTLYIADSQSGQLLAFSLADGKRSGAAAISLPIAQSGPGGPGGRGAVAFGPGGDGALAVDDEGAVYLMADKDLVRIDKDGQGEVLLPGTNYQVGTPRMSVNAILPLSDGSLVVGLRSMEGNALYRYVWDSNASMDPEKKLEIWSLEDSTFVRAVISAFRGAHPDATIDYEAALADDSGLTANDAIKNLNTRLLSGAAPDVIILDGCPADSYAAQGLLLDLAPLIDTGDVFENIIAPFEKSGSLWFVPAQIRFPALIGQEGKIASIKSLEALTDIVVSGNGYPDTMPMPGPQAAEMPEAERPALYFRELRDLFDLVWDSSAAEAVSDGSLDMAALEKMLTAILAISDKYGLCEDKGDGGQMTAMFSDGSDVVRVPDSAIWYSSGFAEYGAFTISSLPLLALQSERPGSALAAFPGLTADSFIPAGLAGIYAETEVPALAAEFIQEMFSYDVQGVAFGTGMPVTTDGLDGQIADHNERVRDNGRGNELGFDVASVVSGLKEPVLTDEVLTGAVWAEAEKLCKGETDMEKALAGIEQSVKNYLAERA